MPSYKIADMHCDTVVCRVAQSKGSIVLRQNNEQLDLERLRAAGVLVQCFAIFIPSGPGNEARLEGLSPYEFFHMAYGYYKTELEKNADILRPALCCDDVMKNDAAGYMSSLLTVEDGMLLDGKLERVDELYEKGVRLITLTWNTENSLGYPNAPEGPDTVHGLKDFGFRAMARMNELGMIVDVSHLSDAGFYDVARHCKKPFVASHSNARALWDAKRNLTDDMLKLLADKGGMTGLNFATHFLGDEPLTTAEMLLRHAKHIVNVAGEDALGFGSDFDGISPTLAFGGCEGFPEIIALFERHFTPRQMDKLTHGNFLRILKACL